MIRRIVPQAWKLRLRLARRAWSDFRSGALRNFAQKSPHQEFPYSLALTQPVLNATTEQSRINKVHNIKIAAASIEEIVIKPGEIFSFWRAVGEPSQKNNFKEGINIIRGDVIEAFGGGLCQLSSIIYHLSLMADLTVVERSNHSVDLYHDKERYTPLGSDCAVFYGYKDLRLRNDHKNSVRFRFEVHDKTLDCFIDSMEPIEKKLISFETVKEDEMGTTVITKTSRETIASSHYVKGQEMPTESEFAFHGDHSEKNQVLTPLT